MKKINSIRMKIYLSLVGSNLSFLIGCSDYMKSLASFVALIQISLHWSNLTVLLYLTKNRMLMLILMLLIKLYDADANYHTTNSADLLR